MRPYVGVPVYHTPALLLVHGGWLVRRCAHGPILRSTCVHAPLHRVGNYSPGADGTLPTQAGIWPLAGFVCLASPHHTRCHRATVFYIYASWLAMVITCFAWRCALVIAIFVAFFVATWDQFTYSQKINTQASKVADASPGSAHQRLDERGLLAAIRRPPSNVTQTAFMLLVFQVTRFAVYGVCFLLALVGYISPVLEQAVYTFGDALAKVSLLLRSSMHRTSLNHCITTSAAAGHQPSLPSTPNDSHTIRYHTISYHTISYHTIPHHTIPYYTIPYHIIPYHAIPCHALPCHAMPYHAIPPHRFPAHGWRRVGCGVVW